VTTRISITTRTWWLRKYSLS